MDMYYSGNVPNYSVTLSDSLYSAGVPPTSLGRLLSYSIGY